jgi:hypothetical protein
VAANRIRALVSRIYTFGAEQRLVPAAVNPVIGVKKPTKETTRDRVLTEEEIRRLWEACATQNAYVCAWFRLRLVTAQRGGELLQMRWRDIDPKSHFWTIPAEFVKNAHGHRVYLSKSARERARLESTVYVGGLLPLDSRRGGIANSPAGLLSVTSGYASRSHYVWAGATYAHHAERDGDQLGSVASFTFVYGYRPPAWRKDYPKPDLRFFIESAGDITGSTMHGGQPISGTGGRIALVGPTMLLLYKAYAIEGGVLFPVYQRNRPMQPDERFRFGLNFTYFFWPSKGKGHWS